MDRLVKYLVIRLLVLLALIFISLVLVSHTYADDAFGSFGVGVANSAKNSKGETKVGNLGYREYVAEGIYLQYKGGFYGDGSGDPSRSSSFYASFGPGMLVDLRPVEMRAGYGLAAISAPDSYLGGRFPQFQGEAYFGFRDPKGNGIGLQYEHISSAGFVTPNMGRDFLVLQLSHRL